MMFEVFKKVVGNQKRIHIFQQQIRDGYLPYTALFHGTEGVGKKLTATCIVASLFCPNRGCGQCSICRRVFEHQHPDFHYVAPEAGKRGISIDQIRQIQRKISLKAFEAGQKFVLLDQAETMNEEASNSFLKTLEEPPQETRIYLITDQKQALLPTILSRVQAIPFHPISSAELRGFLATRARRDKIEFLLAFSQGSIGKALSLLESNLEETRQNLFLWLRRFEDQDQQNFIQKFLSFVPKDLESKEETRRCLAKQTEILILLFRDLMLIPYLVPVINRDQTHLLQSLSKKIFSELAQVVIQELYHYLQTLERNVNIELATQTALSRMYYLLKKA